MQRVHSKEANIQFVGRALPGAPEAGIDALAAQGRFWHQRDAFRYAFSNVAWAAEEETLVRIKFR